MHLHGSLIIKHTKFCVNAIFKDLIYANFITKSFQVKSPWFLPFAYVFVADKACGIVEALSCGDTLKAWWNWQRMSVIRRTTSYFFGLIGGIKKIVQNLEFNALDQLIIQLILDLLLVMINIPVCQALFTRNDKGRIPSSILFKSIVLASLACLMPII